MTGVRVQASVHSGKAVLYFRNTMEKQVDVKGVLLERSNGEEKRAAVAAFPITLGPGEIHPVDVSEPILELLKRLEVGRVGRWICRGGPGNFAPSGPQIRDMGEIGVDPPGSMLVGVA
jgi:hypothetical protein